MALLVQKKIFWNIKEIFLQSGNQENRYKMHESKIENHTFIIFFQNNQETAPICYDLSQKASLCRSLPSVALSDIAATDSSQLQL